MLWNAGYAGSRRCSQIVAIVFARLLARAVVQIASGDRDEVDKLPPRYPVRIG